MWEEETHILLPITTFWNGLFGETDPVLEGFCVPGALWLTINMDFIISNVSLKIFLDLGPLENPQRDHNLFGLGWVAGIDNL